MKPRQWLVLIACLGIILGLFLLLSRAHKPSNELPLPPAPAAQSQTDPAVTAAQPSPISTQTLSPASPSSVVSIAPASVAADTNAPSPLLDRHPDLVFSPSNPVTGIEPRSQVDNMRILIHLYTSMLGENPVGNNQEITRALLGENPKQVVFLKAEAGQRVNANGELVDPWGTPYFFHALSGTEMEIRSAGPDRKMYTADDIVTR